ncbi:alpha-mannosyltransferase LALA0_S15e01684g [Lachancea lanzarotensis]|uniref:LALA0S15e01684g1_1 n=1 Tax=Lachancea lanzarotensis TaxID=1245769 RepID=A0A0C7N475_9SACH|nr:uncharacterized protein LALA0_S15e01684g [Lachancea lanzarotensis]CEP64979.1 LALA0S15e01684g1_1 [Lachancea lanzarotensis]
MPSLSTIMLRGKRYRRLCLLALFFLSAFILSSFRLTQLSNGRSNVVLQSLFEKQREENASGSKISEDKCNEYFRSLASLDSGWDIRSFGHKHTSYFSRRHVQESVRHMRVFGQCFIQNSSPNGDPNLKEVENKLFPLFTLVFPTFTRWDGLIVEGFPWADEATSIERPAVSHELFWRQITDKMNGRGIVMSVGEGGGVSEAKRLLRVLRALQNNLPIQIVHKGDLSDISVQGLVKAGRDPTRIEVADTSYELGHPQEIWFVDAEKSVKPEFAHLFTRYSNKWIASLFNSFEEMIFLDTDAVLFEKPSSFFTIDGYQETGAFFFRDRLIDEYINRGDLNYYKKLLPSKIEAHVFNLETGEDMMRQNDVFQFRFKHVVEAGVFILKRRTHMPGLLISTALNLWKETNEVFHGDKELFWLGQSIAGTSRYQFNKNPAGALGSLTRNKEKNITYTCSAQPGHFDENHKLLWLNGGARYCKWQSWDYDLSKHKSLRKSYKSAKNLRKLYASPIEANGAIIPARSNLSLLQKLLGTKSGFQKCEEMGCAGYLWCAYSRADHSAGLTLEFSQEENNYFKFIVNVWNSE